MKTYLEAGRDILVNGNSRGDRTGTGTVSVFGRQYRFDLAKGFPLLTTKKMFLKGIIHELLWFLNGDTNNNTLQDAGVNIWNEWAVNNRRELGYREALDLFQENNNGISFEEACAHDSELDLMAFLESKGIRTHERLDGDGDLGPVYGHQWRSWKGAILQTVVNANIHEGSVKVDVVRGKHDQISELIENLKKKPFSRRHVISAWNVEDLPDESISPQENVKNGKMALAPCHCLFQFYVREMSGKQRIDWIRANLPEEDARIEQQLKEEIEAGNFRGDFDESADLLIVRNQELYGEVKGVPRMLDCQLYQRSADFALGVPYNIASYALLTMMIAQCCDMIPGEFIHTFGDMHLYRNHIEKFKEQLERIPFDLPVMKINPDVRDIFSFQFSDFQLIGYQSHPKIEYSISV